MRCPLRKLTRFLRKLSFRNFLYSFIVLKNASVSRRASYKCSQKRIIKAFLGYDFFKSY